MKILFFIALCTLAAAVNAVPMNVFDQPRDRIIPVEVYEPEKLPACVVSDRCPAAIISAGYGVDHTKYRFLAEAFLEQGYLVVAVGHELPGDPPLSISGDLYETRKENWSRGAKSLTVVRAALKKQFPGFNFDQVTLVGHSNGGDISAWFANREPEAIKELITLDHRRVPLPKKKGFPILSVRAGDFPADEGVLPHSSEQKAFDACVVEFPRARHNDMTDDGPQWLRRAVYSTVFEYISGRSSCAKLKQASVAANAEPAGALITALERLETNLGSRVGFSAHDLETGRRWEYQANERFAMASTFKTLACAALLHRVDKDEESLDRKVSFSASDLVTYSPVTERYAGREAMSLFVLCEATLTMSDNTAANMVLKALGGPEEVTSFVRTLGDDVTRLDRWETELNEATPEDERDTTTPNAMVANLEKLILGDVLSVGSRNQLRSWLESNQVADDLFRSSVPDEWVVADRTGAGGHGLRAITAVIWPPERQPVIVALYLAETDASFAERNEAIAKIGTLIKDTIEDN